MGEEINVIGTSIEFRLDKVVYNKESFTIARVFSNSEQIAHMKDSYWNNVSIKGQMPELKRSIVYVANISEVEKNKYGTTLSVDSVYPRDFSSDNINTDSEMIGFIEVFIGEGTADKLREVEGVCKIIKNGKVEKLTSIRGVGNKTAHKIISTYETEAVGSKYLVKLKKIGFSDKEVNKLKELYAKNLMTAWEQINKDIFKLVFKGFRMDRMDNIFLENMNGDKRDKKRIKAYIWKSIKDFMLDGYKSYLTVEQFYNLEVIKNIECNIDRELLDLCIEELKIENKIKIINDEIITNYDEWIMEYKLVNLIEDIIDKQDLIPLPIVDIDKDIEEQESIIGFSLNQGQRKAVKDIIMSKSSLCMLNGLAGTGKTSVTKVILNIYAKYSKSNFKLCALSGRASSVLGESSGYKELSSTMHKVLGRDFITGEWIHTRNNMFTDLDVLVIDEISMIDYYMLYSILAPCNSKVKVILLGDNGQLPSLAFGKTIETLKRFDIQFNELTQVMRQSEDAYILKIANDSREGINPFENTRYKWYGKDTEVCIGDSYEYMIDSFIEEYKNDNTSSIVVTTTKAKTDRINFDIQERLINEKLVDDSKPFIEKTSNTKGKIYKMYEGDYIMVLKNKYNVINFTGKDKNDFFLDEIFEGENPFEVSYEYLDEDEIMPSPQPLFNGSETDIFNGEIYLIKEIFDKYIILSNEDGDVLLCHEDLNCQLAYSCNCHKLQGSGFKNVFVYTTDEYIDRIFMVNRQWLYTAYTRAKERLRIHTNKFSNLSTGISKNAIDEKVTLIDYCMNNEIDMKNIK